MTRLLPLLDALWCALLDLVVGRACSGCGAPGRLLCHRCRAAVDAWRPHVVERAGLAPVVACTSYDGIAARLLVGFKDRDAVALGAPLGRRLAVAVAAQVQRLSWCTSGRVVLVPAPTTRAARRRRGYDHTLLLARTTVRELRRHGVPARVAPVLRRSRAVADQASLDLGGRAANQRGSMCFAGRARDRNPPDLDDLVLLLDDIVTTGATLREASRVLEEQGWWVRGVVTVAQTPRRAGGAVGGDPTSSRLGSQCSAQLRETCPARHRDE